MTKDPNSYHERIIWASLAFVAGMLATAGAMATIQTKPSAQPAQSPAPQEDRQYAFQTSFNNVLNDLQTKQGFELDHHAYNNLIVIDQNTIGLLYKISSDASNPQLKALAEQMRAQRQAEVDQLFVLQKATGHTHH